METDVVCPDCGKVIAPEGAVENALRCRCGESKGPRVSVDEVPTRPRISVPIPEAPPSTDDDNGMGSAGEDDSGGALTSKEKICYVCGTNLAGRTRLKDHLGRYWCKECAAADKRAKEREDDLRCPDCSRVFPAHKLKYFQTTRVCSSCYKARELELEKKIVKANINKVEKAHEWQTLKWMAIAVIALIGIATIFQFLR